MLILIIKVHKSIAIRIILVSIFILFFFVFPIKIYAAQPLTGIWTYVGLSNYVIHSFAVDPNNPTILYAGTAGNGIFKSTDGGDTWNAINNGITNYTGYFTEIVIDPTDSNVVYAGGVSVDDGSTGILKSTNGGASWVYAHNGITDVGFGGPPRDVFSMVINSSNHNILYAALGWMCGSVYKTTNATGLWTRGIGLPCDPTVVRIDPFNSNIIYTRSAQGISKSIDGGVNWNPISNFGNYFVFHGLAIDAFNSNNLYVNTDTGLYKSTDGGVNWAISSGTLNNVYKALVSDPVRPNTVYAGEDAGIETSAYVTTNGGSTWTDITNGLPNVGVKRLFVPENNPNVLYTTTDSGIYVYGLTDNQPVTLNIPYFSQNDSSWGPTEYDHSIKLGFSDPTMNRWGCAVTSAAMVLNFHNIKEMPDGTDLDPGSLNVWLKNNNGYAIGYKNMDGWYSYLKFPSISTLTKRIFDKEKSDIKLEYKRAKTNLTQTLDSDLSIGKFPDIIKVSNNETSSHFVVAKGKSNNTYLINDPEWNHPTLESFNNNTFSQLDRFVPSNTNLSYLLAVVNPGVEMMITAPDNKRTGKNLTNNEELNQINNASYSLQLPISNPNDNDQNENLGTGVNEFLLPEPIEGNYEIKLSSEENGFYEINLATFKENGDNDSNYIRGIITENNDETIKANYSQVNNTNINKIVSFSDLIKDLNELKGMNQFKNNGIYNSLLAKATAAQLINFVNEKTSKNILKALLNEIKSQRGKGITEDAYQVLFYDINYLINT